jgi:hypothetical protein
MELDHALYGLLGQTVQGGDDDCSSTRRYIVRDLGCITDFGVPTTCRARGYDPLPSFWFLLF